MKAAAVTVMILPAILAVVSGARTLQQLAPGAPMPCLCTDASIFTGQTYCFHLTPTYDNNHRLTNLAASPQCSQGYYLTCANAAVELPEGTTTQYFSGAVVEGQGLNCTLTSFLPPPPLAPPASAGAPECACSPAGNYGPMGYMCFNPEPAGGGSPSDDCVAPSGSTCTISLPLSRTNSSAGTSKLCELFPSPATAPAVSSVVQG